MSALWSDWELAILYAHFDDPCYLSKVSELLPARSKGTIRNRMCQLRAEANFKAERIATERELKRDAKAGSAELLQALHGMLAA